MGIMVFDRYTRVRLPFNSSPQDVQREFDRLLRQERFNGGTDITRAMLDAADYIRREGRRDARRAIVILTDDQTEFDRDDEGVGRALARADAVMCALIAPDARQYGGSRGGGGQRPVDVGGGGGLGGGLGGIIFGRAVAAATAIRAAEAVEAHTNRLARRRSPAIRAATACRSTTPRRSRRRSRDFASATRCISIFPKACSPAQERNIVVDLTAEARQRYSDAEVRYRRTSMSDTGGRGAGPTKVTRAPSDSGLSDDSSTPSVHRRRVAVNEDGTPVASPDPQQ